MERAGSGNPVGAIGEQPLLAPVRADLLSIAAEDT